jgi:hypothetical protein
MDKFSLEVQNWGNWELERDFSSLDRAIRFGRERFPENEWRVYDRVAREVVHVHDPAVALEQTARQEFQRFQTTERWRERFAERAAAEVLARQQRERIAEVAARQREREQVRRNRLRGFRFVGEPPEILRMSRPTFDAIEDLFDDESRVRDRDDKVDWLKEGF